MNTEETTNKEVKIYFKGGEGITDPVDVNGNRIEEGGILTHCWFRVDFPAFFHQHYPRYTQSDIERETSKPSVIVKRHEEGYLFGEGLQESSFTGTKTYMHDFEFKHTKKFAALGGRSIQSEGPTEGSAEETGRQATPKELIN